jgi:long-chain fatty acid transport protein
VFRYALGAVWRPDEHMVLRFGAAYDESPIQDEFRTARLPTNDRIWGTLGLGYKLSESAYVDVTYLHVWIKDGDIDETNATGQRLKGTYEAHADVLGISLSIGF